MVSLRIINNKASSGIQTCVVAFIVRNKYLEILLLFIMQNCTIMYFSFWCLNSAKYIHRDSLLFYAVKYNTMKLSIFPFGALILRSIYRDSLVVYSMKRNTITVCIFPFDALILRNIYIEILFYFMLRNITPYNYVLFLLMP